MGVGKRVGSQGNLKKKSLKNRFLCNVGRLAVSHSNSNYERLGYFIVTVTMKDLAISVLLTALL